MSTDVKIYIFKKNKRTPVTCIEKDGYESPSDFFRELGVKINTEYDNETLIPNDVFKKYLNILCEQSQGTWDYSYYQEIIDYISDEYEVYYTTW